MGTAQGIALWAFMAVGLAIGFAVGVGRGRQLQAREDARKLAVALHRESLRQ